MSDQLSFSPHIVVSDAAAAIEFYKAAFGAVEMVRHLAPNNGKVMHACVKIAGGNLMLNDDFSAAMGGKPETAEALGGSPVTFHIQTQNADAAWAKALAAGATVKLPLADQFWGDRYGMLRDPFGLYWSIGQTVSKPTAAEIEERAKAVFAD
ncbi:MAG: VOC family protein [Terracidiphilus sp.]|jgi:PhnB protein